MSPKGGGKVKAETGEPGLWLAWHRHTKDGSWRAVCAGWSYEHALGLALDLTEGGQVTATPAWAEPSGWQSEQGQHWGLRYGSTAWLGQDSADSRRIFTGANWSAAIGNPFRSFGDTGEGLETALAEFRATRHEPVVYVLHLAQPRISYLDRGKSSLVIGGAQ
jgi:hypothetical protein